jgi:hypothetical protein
MDTQKSTTGVERVHERVDQLDRRVTTLEANERNTDRRIAVLESMPRDIAEIKSLLATLTARLDGHRSTNAAWQGWSQALLMLVIAGVVGAGFMLFRGGSP